MAPQEYQEGTGRGVIAVVVAPGGEAKQRERVVAHLADPWSLAKLAREAGYSNEHLRRLCRRQLGRSPMHQVTYLRMRRATELLASTELTIEAIAHEVGYHNPFVFSNAFTKWIGWSPSEYRRKKLPTNHRRKSLSDRAVGRGSRLSDAARR